MLVCAHSLRYHLSVLGSLVVVLRTLAITLSSRTSPGSRLCGDVLVDDLALKAVYVRVAVACVQGRRRDPTVVSETR